jgi:paired amphipathic helix protein Sin3a
MNFFLLYFVYFHILQKGDGSKTFVNGPSATNSTKPFLAPATAVAKVEREEGELSPNVDFEEDNFVAFDSSPNPTSAIAAPPSNASKTKPTGTENDAEVDEESAHRSAEDSDNDNENASENGEDGSGSESGEGEDCSREEDQEEEDEEGGAESEGEADGATIGVVDEKDTAALPYSDRFVRTVRPVTKHVSMEEKASRVFYGNDSFYILFRLHQV